MIENSIIWKLENDTEIYDINIMNIKPWTVVPIRWQWHNNISFSHTSNLSLWLIDCTLSDFIRRFVIGIHFVLGARSSDSIYVSLIKIDYLERNRILMPGETNSFIQLFGNKH